MTDMPKAKLKSKTTSNRPAQRRLRVQRVVSLRREWKRRVDDLLNGKNWAVNDKACKEARANKAEGIHECIVGINWLLSQKGG